ncbi:Hypothetical predicted protein, partial [Paramuricea clavata]
MWKLVKVNPSPKECPLTDCSQLRPISLTNIIMRLFERVIYKQEIASAFKSVVGQNKFAYKEGTSTTDALIMCLHHWLEWLDEGADYVRVNDVKPVDAKNNRLVKFADDITASAPVKSGLDSASAEVEGIQNWSETNQMTLNISKTWEMVVQSGSTKSLPTPIVGIEQKSWLKLLGTTFQDNPCSWDLHVTVTIYCPRRAGVDHPNEWREDQDELPVLTENYIAIINGLLQLLDPEDVDFLGDILLEENYEENEDFIRIVDILSYTF